MGHAHDDGSTNPTGNRPFADIIDTWLSRRRVLGGGLAAAAAFLGTTPADAARYTLQGRNPTPRRLAGFTPVPLAGGGGRSPRIAAEYRYEVIIPWGTPIAPGAKDTVGIGHDGMHYFALDERLNHGLLVINHEYGDNIIVLGKTAPASLEDVRASQYAHGLAVIELARIRGKWQTVDYRGYARRVHVNSPVSFSGPAAGSALLQNPANNPPLGTVNNCANGATPWGTYLTCEENFNGYFGANGSWTASAAQRRYGMSAAGAGYGWHRFDERFDMSNPAYANEQNRFGWIVEVDPVRPDAPPVKRTALGRFKHEGIALVEGGGQRVVGYMGDDERNDYIYKFVSADNWKSMVARGVSPLDEGRLYVARFNDDGSGQWLELTIANPLLGARFASQAEILVNVRLAADALGATPMDRPEWTTVAPNGLVYCTLTNNTARTVANAANPLTPNPNGHIIRWLDADNHLGLTFSWEIFVLAEDTAGTAASFASPDGLWADPDGRLFIETDGAQNDGLNDQLLVADIFTGEIRRLFEGVQGAEVTGIAVTPDRTTMFVNLQHPNPDTAVPRDATIAISRIDGGIVGS